MSVMICLYSLVSWNPLPMLSKRDYKQSLPRTISLVAKLLLFAIFLLFFQTKLFSFPLKPTSTVFLLCLIKLKVQ